MSWSGDNYTLPAGYDIPVVANSALGMRWSYDTMLDIENAFDGIFSLTHSFAGTITFNGPVVFNSNWTIAQSSSGISGSNANLANHSTPNIRLTNGGLVSLATLGTTGVTTGHQVWLHNDTGNSIIIIDQYGSPPSNSAVIITTYGANQTLRNQGSVMLEYDSIDSAWRAIAWSGRTLTLAEEVAAGSNTQIQFNSSGAFGASSSLTFNGTNMSVGGGVIATSVLLSLTGTLPNSGTNSFGVYSNGTVPAASTSAYQAYVSIPSTAAAAFTLADLTHFRAEDVTKGAGSTVTSQEGFFAADLSHASSNYGFYGNLSSGAAKWNFYAGGTAKSYFAGQVGIGQTTPDASSALDITSTTQGFLPPRMTTAQKNAISSPAEGLVVNDSTLHALCVYENGAWTSLGSGGGGAPSFGGRLTLVTGTPVMSSDQSAITNVYYTPYIDDQIAISNGTTFTNTTFTEITLALDATAAHTGYQQSGKNFDLFVYSDSGTLRLITGPAWTSDTARGTGAGTTELQQLKGVWTNKNSMTGRFGSASGNTVTASANTATYVGTMRASADGQCSFTFGAVAASGTESKFYLWNAYNRVITSAGPIGDTTDSWTYNSQTYREPNGSSTMQVGFVLGLIADAVDAVYSCYTKSTANNSPIIALGLDSTSAKSANCTPCAGTAPTLNQTCIAFTKEKGLLGYHFVSALERKGNAIAEAQTFYGDAGDNTQVQNGLFATLVM